jgi:tRNA (guanine37-N1)-methyltransferase
MSWWVSLDKCSITTFQFYPHYTRPEDYDGQRVPDVLLSGHHEQIRRWRLKQALGRTWQRRPDLLAVRSLSKEETQLLGQYQEQCGQETKKEF